MYIRIGRFIYTIKKQTQVSHLSYDSFLILPTGNMHCNTLPHTATRRRQGCGYWRSAWLCDCNTMQHTAPHCN